MYSLTTYILSRFLTKPANRPGATAFVLPPRSPRTRLWRYWRKEMVGRDRL